MKKLSFSFTGDVYFQHDNKELDDEKENILKIEFSISALRARADILNRAVQTNQEFRDMAAQITDSEFSPQRFDEMQKFEKEFDPIFTLRVNLENPDRPVFDGIVVSAGRTSNEEINFMLEVSQEEIDGISESLRFSKDILDAWDDLQGESYYHKIPFDFPEGSLEVCAPCKVSYGDGRNVAFPVVTGNAEVFARLMDKANRSSVFPHEFAYHIMSENLPDYIQEIESNCIDLFMECSFENNQFDADRIQMDIFMQVDGQRSDTYHVPLSQEMKEWLFEACKEYEEVFKRLRAEPHQSKIPYKSKEME